MSTDSNKSDVNLLVYGKIGNGKSATANSIIGTKEFGKKELVVKSSEFNGRQIKVVDGLSVDTKLDAQDVQELHQVAAEAVEKYRPFHAIIIVLKYGSRFTQADKDILRFLKLTFGKDVVSNHGVVVMTNGDVFEADQEEADEQEKEGISFEQWCSQQTGLFREIMNECKDRIVLFNNRQKDEAKKRQQVEELLKRVDKTKSGGYTMDVYKKAEDSRKLHMLEAQEPAIRKTVLKDVKAFENELKEIEQTMSKTKYEKYETKMKDFKMKVNDYQAKLEEKWKLTDKEMKGQAEKIVRDVSQPIRILIEEMNVVKNKPVKSKTCSIF